jgi:hypothetical protein
MVHYHSLIRQFGAPNGLCSSITESKHIRAVKEPWRRSNRNEALGQMLVTNQRLDQLVAARTDFATRGMLTGTCLSEVLVLQAAQALGELCLVIFADLQLLPGTQSLRVLIQRLRITTIMQVGPSWKSQDPTRTSMKKLLTILTFSQKSHYLLASVSCFVIIYVP